MTRFGKQLGFAVLLLAMAFLLACSGHGSGASAAPPPPPLSIPAQGSATTLDIAEWNLEWFGSSSNGPINENLQQQNVRDVIAGVDCDIWGLEEVVSPSAFNGLVAALPGYAGLPANVPAVVNGTAYLRAN